jgi:hypothetical protein
MVVGLDKQILIDFPRELGTPYELSTCKITAGDDPVTTI